MMVKEGDEITNIVMVSGDYFVVKGHDIFSKRGHLKRFYKNKTVCGETIFINVDNIESYSPSKYVETSDIPF